jgi:hypothetical protein
MKKFFQNWNATRIFRLVIALGIGIYGIVAKDYLILPLAGWFLIMVVFNMSCCGAGGCSSGENNTKQVYKGIIKPYKK